MYIMNFNANFSESDSKQAAQLRDSNLHPADFEFGMDDSIPVVQGFDEDGFTDTATDNSFDTGFNAGFNNGFDDSFGTGSDSMGTPFGGGGLPPMNTGAYTPFDANTVTTEKKDVDEQVVDATVKAAKESWQFLKECVGAYKHMKYADFMSAGKESTVLGAVLSVVGLVVGLFGVGAGWALLVGAAVAIPSGVVMYIVAKNKNDKALNSVQNTQEIPQDGYTVAYDANGMSEMDDEFMSEYADDTAVEDETSEEYDADFTMASTTESYDADTQEVNTSHFTSANFTKETDATTIETSNVPAFNFEDAFDDDFDSTTSETMNVNPDVLINSINVDKAVVTRQYLYDCFVPMLQHANPDFAVETTLAEGTHDFDNWVTAVHFAVDALRTNETAEEPQLLRVRQKLYYVILEVQRVAWLKNLDKFAEEIVNTVAYDAETNKRNPDVYAEATAAGKTIYVKVMTGSTSSLITVRDIYDVQHKFVCNTENVMPVAIGLDINGAPVMQDLKKVESMLIAGQPRSGKSWFLKTLIAQLMMFNSPRDLNFYFCDPKDKISDFIDIQTPHVKKFTADDASIIETVEYLAHIEGARRQNIFSKVGVKSIWEYREKCPDEDMPLIYLIIDEIITLTSRMEQEERKTFEKLLLEYITRLPAYGIRIWIVPHMVKNTVLSKNVTDMVQWRGCIRYSNTDVCKVLDVKTFPYKLPAQGDMAMRTPDGDVSFVHDAVLATDNASYSKIFDSIARVWHKIDDSFVAHVEVVHAKGEEAVSSTQSRVAGTKRTVNRTMRKRVTTDTNNITMSNETMYDDVDDEIIW